MISRILFLGISLTLMGCMSGAKSSLDSFSTSANAQDSGFAPGADNSCEVKFATEGKVVGEFTSEIQDDFANSTDIRKNYITSTDGKRMELIGNVKLESVNIGDTIEVEGNNQGLIRANSNGEEQINVSSIKVLNSKIQNTTMKDYKLKVLTVIMDFEDRVSSSVYSLAQGKSDLVKLQKYVSDNSGGQMDFDIDFNGDGEPDVEVIKVTRPFSSRDCTPRLDQNVDLTSLLKNHSAQSYDTVIYVASAGLTGNDPICGYGGIANVGALGSGKNGSTHVAIPKFNVILHELGHTWGLGHSGTAGVTYAHTICPMGNSFSNNVTHFNAPKTKMLGLMDNRPELSRTLTDNGTYEMDAIGNGVTFSSGGTLPRVITLQSGSETYYLEYRNRAGEDADAPSSVSKFMGINMTQARLTAGGVSEYVSIINTSNTSFNFSGGKIELVDGIAGESVKFKLTFDNPSANPPYEGSKCDNSKVTASLVKAVNEPGYEVSYNIENNNDLDCGELVFDINLESEVFSLAESQSIKVASGQKIDIKSKLLVKNSALLKETGNTGTIEALEASTKVGKQSIAFSIDKKASEECSQ